MKRFTLAAISLFTSLLKAQQQTLTATSTLVLVPAIVRSPTGELIPSLNAADFRLTDNGTTRPVRLSARTGYGSTLAEPSR